MHVGIQSGGMANLLTHCNHQAELLLLLLLLPHSVPHPQTEKVMPLTS